MQKPHEKQFERLREEFFGKARSVKCSPREYVAELRTLIEETEMEISAMRGAGDDEES